MLSPGVWWDRSQGLSGRSLDGRAWPTREGLHRAVFDYIEGWYNTRRIHSSLGYLSPAEYETIHHNNNQRTA